MRFDVRMICIIIVLFALVATWHSIYLTEAIPNLLLPSPLSVGQALISLVRTKLFWLDLGSTVVTWIAGIILGTTLGGALGLLFALNRYIWIGVEPLVEFLRALPSVVLVPLISLFLGVGSTSRLASATLVVMLLMISSSASAVHATRSSYVRLAAAWRVTPFQMIREFYLPATLSHLTIALRAAIPLALIVVVAADMLIATEAGIGRILMDSLAAFDTKKLYAGVIVVGLLGYVAARLSAFLEAKTIHWSGS